MLSLTSDRSLLAATTGNNLPAGEVAWIFCRGLQYEEVAVMKWCRHGLQGDVSLSTAIQSPYNTFVSKQRMLSVLAYGYKTQLLFGRMFFANHAHSGLRDGTPKDMVSLRHD